MKREDIDKRIGMPDVDAEWARFEREVINKDAKPGLWRVTAWAGGIGIAAAIALLFVLNMGKEEIIEQPLMAQQPQRVHVESTAADTIPVEESQSVKSTYEQPQEKLVAYAEPVARNAAETPTVGSTANDRVYDCGEILARFPGGDRALKAFIDSLFVCPELAIDYGAKGRVIVTFMVDTLGQTSDFRVARNRFACDSTLLTSMTSEAKDQLRERLSEQLSAEAIRVLSQMPRWTPAEQFGKIVSQKWTVPVIFNGQKAWQGRIAGLDIVPSSDSLGRGNIIRLAGAVRVHQIDSFAVILNGAIVQDSIAQQQAYPQIYLYKQHQIINSIKVYKDESSRARFETTFGFPPPKGGFIEIEAIPDTLCDAYVHQHPEVKQTRRYIEGYVWGEDDQPLADAWIGCDTSNMGAATDSTGHFVMWAPRTVTKLYVRHVGYQTIRHTIQPADTILNFRMKDATKIKEVKVMPKVKP